MTTTPYLDEIIARGAGGIPTTELWEELRALLDGSMGRRGSLTLAGSAGVVVGITDIGTEDYDVFFSAEKAGSAGSIGEITYEIIDSASFKVYNSGSDAATTVRYWAVPRPS